MAEKLTDKIVKELPKPPAGRNQHIIFDGKVSGFGCRVTASGARSFVLDYRTRTGRQRRYTIGRTGEWTVGQARDEAKELKKKIDRGDDPLAEIRADREAPSMAELCTRFEEDHLPKKRPATARDYKAIINNHILPKLRHMKVAEVAFSDVDALHRKITRDGAPFIANRTVAVLSKMFNLAIQLRQRADNPAKGIERNQETKRERYLSPGEVMCLTDALAGHSDQQAANIIRLLLLTGARRMEVMAARWEQFDLEKGIWTKPGATTKQKTMHRVPLSEPARVLLSSLRKKADDEADHVFPGRGTPHRKDVKKDWAAVCKAAKIKGARLHDLRHTYASILASSGHSLPIIGKLLGHTQAQTTARYSHLQDDPLRLATDQAGEIISGKKTRKKKL